MVEKYIVLVDRVVDCVDVPNYWERRVAGYFENYDKADEFARSFGLPRHIAGDGVVSYKVSPEDVEIGEDFYVEVYLDDRGAVYHVINGVSMIDF